MAKRPSATDHAIGTGARRLGFVAVAVLALSLPFWPPVRSLDLLLLDARFAVLREIAVKPLARDVVVVGFDEATYKAFPEPFALWHGHLGKLFEAFAAGTPAVVGLDLSFPDRSFNFLIPGQDQKLLLGLVALKRVAPVVLGRTVDETGQARRIYPPYVSVAGPDGVAYVLWRQDSDRVVRRFTPALGDRGETVPTLVGTMAGHMGIAAVPGLIDFAVGGEFAYVPMHRVTKWFEDGDIGALRAAFAGRPVLVGSTLPFVDRHYQPVDLAGWEENDNFVPGVLIHAQALRSLMAGGLIAEAPVWAVPLLTLALTLLWWVSRRMWSAAAAGLAALAALAVAGTWLLHAGTAMPVAALLLTAAIAAGGRVALETAGRAAERQRLRRAFRGYISPLLMEEILKGNLDPGLHGRRMHLCLMFSDLRGFTAMSEKMPPQDIIGILNRYLERMTRAIQDNGGAIDKFMGDGIMALFGAPQPLDNPTRYAFDAAKQMLDELDALNAELVAEGRPMLRIGIGLHEGYVIVGNIGSERRNEYTAIGDTVNTCSRIEGLTRDTDYPLLISKQARQSLPDDVPFAALGEMVVKGRNPVEVYGWPVREEAPAPAALPGDAGAPPELIR